MSNNKPSSIDSLFQKLWDTSKDKFTWYAILEEHKAMHKEEIIHSYRCGAAEVGMIAVNKPKQYYNEIYGDKQ